MGALWRCSCSCPRPSMQLAAHHKPGARVERGSKSGSWSSWDCPRRPDSGSSMATAIECGMAAFHDSDTSQLDGCSLFTTVVIAAAEPGWLAFEGRRAARASVPRCTGKGEPGRLHSGALDSGGQGTTEWRSVGYLTHHNFGLSAGGSSPPTVPGPIASIASLDGCSPRSTLPAAAPSPRCTNGCGLLLVSRGAAGFCLCQRPSWMQSNDWAWRPAPSLRSALAWDPGALPHGCQGPLSPLRGRRGSRARLGGKSGSSRWQASCGPGNGPLAIRRERAEPCLRVLASGCSPDELSWLL